MPKLKLAGEKLTLEAAPVPVRATVCGLPVALSVTVMVPGWLPVAVGVKVTLMVQLAAGATEVPQVLVWAYCVLAAMLVRLSAAVPGFDSVTVCAALLMPTAWLANVRLVGEKLTLDAAPVPVSATVCGLPVALSVTVIVPGWLPVAVGVKVTLMVQLAAGATEVPQVLVWAYCVLAVMLVRFSNAVPVLVRVTVCAALAVFTF